MKRSQLKAIAKDNLKFQWGSSLLALVLFALIVSAGNIVPVIGAFIVSGPMLVGLELVYFAGSQKVKMNLWDLFKGFELCFGESVLLGILKNIFITLWSLLFIIPGIIKQYSYFMSSYIMMRQPDMSAIDAITLSRKMMDGHKWELFMLDLSFLGWYILCVLTLGILALYVEPYQSHAHILFKNNIYDSYMSVSAPQQSVSENAAVIGQ